MKKKFRSKWFRVATAGATSDGRKIEASWIQEMAASYNPTVYGARIWMEHIRSTVADSPFRAYGDVVAVKAEEVDVGGEKRLALFAQIEPTPDLINLNKAKQKIYTSIEVSEKFADSGKAYLVGLGVTDSPASLGTDVLSFAAQNPDANPYKSRKQHPDNMFTASVEVELDFEEVDDNPSKLEGLFARVNDLLGRSKTKASKDDANFTELNEAVEALATHAAEQAEAASTQATSFRTLQEKQDKLSTDFAELLERLGTTVDHSQTQRPPVTGGDGAVLTAY
ncbi:GPO family capsid scaffolding protein [Pseudomonas sp. UBA4194]|uniref:GPO family capsid scaffolding protein n=1 Tax=Pseudomonas sp. UBA4194 TaxID=1947317 RepID=UPI0026014877|nr:GPO family capsid scaffolding protein [Pseudomonas sp. UBA4194]